MAIVYQHDKRSGITYAYDSHAWWDKEKQMSRATRRLIGRVDPATGQIVPTNGRNRKDRVKTPPAKEPDYKELYLEQQKQLAAQEILIEALQKEIEKLKENR